MKLEELEQLIEKLRALGVTKYSHDGVDLELGPAPKPPPPRPNGIDRERQRKLRRMHEDMLQFASSEGFYDVGDDSLTDEEKLEVQ